MMHAAGPSVPPATPPRFPSMGLPAHLSSGAGRAPRRVLIVDDERDLADLAEDLLRACGLEVAVAYCAADALSILESEPQIDAVFSDVMMPGMTGIELAEAIAQRYPSIRIVLTTGFALPELMDNHGRPYPCAAKPYRIETVLELLRR
jgi:two-component system OmpR family response regulator